MGAIMNKSQIESIVISNAGGEKHFVCVFRRGQGDTPHAYHVSRRSGALALLASMSRGHRVDTYADFQHLCLAHYARKWEAA